MPPRRKQVARGRANADTTDSSSREDGMEEVGRFKAGKGLPAMDEGTVATVIRGSDDTLYAKFWVQEMKIGEGNVAGLAPVSRMIRLTPAQFKKMTKTSDPLGDPDGN